MKSVARAKKRTRFNVRMVFVLFLREIQWYRAVGFAVNKLMHLGIWAGADFIRRTLCDNPVASKHNHPGRDAKSARHIVRHNHGGHMAAAKELFFIRASPLFRHSTFACRAVARQRRAIRDCKPILWS